MSARGAVAESAGHGMIRRRIDGATMLSILVCHSYYLRLDHKQVLRAKPYPPLATLQVVAMLREAGHRVSFFDSMLADGPDVTDAPGPYLDAGADLALVGEGLSTLFAVLPRLDASPDADTADLVRGVSGVVSLSSGKALTQ